MITSRTALPLRPLAGRDSSNEEHEHVPEMIAASLGNHLVHSIRGPEQIRDIIVDDVGAAFHRGDLAHARHVVDVLKAGPLLRKEAAPALRKVSQ